MSTLDLTLIKPYVATAKQCEKTFPNIPARLILAICYQESRGNQWAVRFEPGYYHNPAKWFLVEHYAKMNGITNDTEAALQSFSWGPMQVMGATARHLGFANSLQSLCSSVGIYWGAKTLNSMYRDGYTIEDLASCYNHGSREKDEHGKYIIQSYIDSVVSYYQTIKKLE